MLCAEYDRSNDLRPFQIAPSTIGHRFLTLFSIENSAQIRSLAALPGRAAKAGSLANRIIHSGKLW